MANSMENLASMNILRRLIAQQRVLRDADAHVDRVDVGRLDIVGLGHVDHGVDERGGRSNAPDTS